MEDHLKKNIYSFLSKLIYVEFYERGINNEYALSLSLYLQLCVANEYLSLTREFSLTPITNLHKRIPKILSNENENNAIARTLYDANREVINSIYTKVINLTPLSSELGWEPEWKQFCSTTLYEHNKSIRDLNYLRLLQTVHESLGLTSDTISISLRLIDTVLKENQILKRDRHMRPI